MIKKTVQNQVIHQPVLLETIIDLFNPQAGQNFIDTTLGDAGHSLALLKKIKAKGTLISLDYDQASIDFVQSCYAKEMKTYQNWIIVKSNFTHIDQVVQKYNLDQKINGILFDLGLSSRQLGSDRGFSFSNRKPLDMRMDTSQNIKAYDLLNGLYKKELVKMFTLYGDLPLSLAQKLSQRITEARREKLFGHSDDVARINEISKFLKRFKPKIHPSTLVFQALRITVNDELNNLKTGLKKAFPLLADQGKIIVVSYHSLEDRIVKHYFRELKQAGLATISKKIIQPSETEIKANAKASSAKLRYCQKLSNLNHLPG